MTAVWAQRQEELLSDCAVSPDVFDHMVDRLRDYVAPYQHSLETEAGQRHMYLYLQGLLSHLDRKNAEKIAALVGVERLILQAFIGTAPWDHRPLVKVLVGQVTDRLGEPDGVIAFDPSSFPKRGTHSVGVKRQWCGHRGKVDTCQVGVYMGYVSRHDHAVLDFRFSLPEDWARDQQRRRECHVPEEVQYRTRQEQCLERVDLWGEQVPHGWVTGDDALGRHTRFRRQLRERGERYVLGVPCTTTMRDLEAPLPAYQGRGRRPKAPWQSVTDWRKSLKPTVCLSRDTTSFRKWHISTCGTPPFLQLPRGHGGTLQSEGREVDALGMPIDNQLCHGETAGRGIQNTPAAMACGKIGPGDTGHLAEERQSVLCHWAITGLHALWSQTRQG
jgi:hypothetical protein